MTKLDVIGLGEVCIDWVVYVERFPEIDEKIFVRNYETFVGGVTANFLVAFSRLGGKPGFLGGVGEDENGRRVLEKLSREGVDVTHVKKWPHRTAVNIVVVDKEGRKYIYQDPYLRENVPDEVPEDYILKAKHLHSTAIKIKPTLKAFNLAIENGLTTSLDLEKHVAKYGLEKLKPILEKTTILMPNKLGLLELTHEKDYITAAKKMLKYGPKIVVVTVGEKGSIVVTEKEVIKTPAFKVKVVDTTGAGDTFNATFIYGLTVKKLNLEKASILANAAAALKCTKKGAQSSPTLEETLKFISKNNVIF